MKFFVLTKRSLLLFAAGIALLAFTIIYSFQNFDSISVLKPQTTQKEKERSIHLVTGEFKSVLQSGKEIEAYRWDPGTIFVEKGEKVQLIIYGVNGKEHPFHIEGTNVKGVVKKGKETIVPLKFKKEGVYRLICELHPDKEHDGPMIAYIVVD